MQTSRRKFLQASLLTAGASLLKLNSFAVPYNFSKPAIAQNTPQLLLDENRLNLSFDKEMLVMNEGLQPSMLCTRKGNFIVQAQLPKKPLPQKRIYYPFAIKTVTSYDKGRTWNEFPLKAGDNGLNMEGGIVQLRNGNIIALETYITPGSKPDTGVGLLYTSSDEYRTLQGPFEITLNMPNADFYSSSDDGGRPHEAMRFHRRIIELPNGDLMTTVYGFQKGDKSPADYMPSMMKSRAMLFRSSNQGRHWDYVSTIAADGTVGTEGFGEPTLVRISKGKHAGRLISMMRTGYALYEAKSDDEGKTWTKAEPRVFANLDVYKTGEWADLFKGVKRNGKLISENPKELYGSVVDPDLCEMKNGVLVASFGVRITARASWNIFTHPWNGNYLAFSLDQGDTWSQVVRITSGIPTTHYMAIEQMPNKNELFVIYDWGYWGYKPGRYIYGRKVTVKI
jgi:hypothetical protein